MSDKAAYENGVITVKGLVIPVAWNRAGEPVGVSISTYNEIDYRVESGGLEQDILKLVQREVDVTGRVRMSPGGEPSIRVTAFHPTGRPKARRGTP